MSLFHFLNCVALCFLPHVVYYHATDMAEYDVLRSVVHGFVCQLGTSFAKVVVLAFLLPGTETTNQEWAKVNETRFGGAHVPQADKLNAGHQALQLRQTIHANLGLEPNADVTGKDGAQVLVALIDMAGLWFALVSKFAHRNTSNAHKFQAVGVGWAFADSVLKRAAPLWLGGFSPEFTFEHVQAALKSNVVLIQSLSFAAVGSLIWNKKSKPLNVVPMLKASLVLHAVAPIAMSLAEQHAHIPGFPALGMEFGVSVICALTSWKLYSWCTQKQG